MKKEKLSLEEFSKAGLEQLSSALDSLSDADDKYRLTISLTNTSNKKRSSLGLCYCKDASGKKDWRDCDDCV